MSYREKKAFKLNYSLYISFFEVKVDYTMEERVIDYISKSFNNLDSIFCPLSEDETDSIANVRGGKLILTTTSGLLKLKMLSRVKSEDSRGMNISSS
jgi:hypothetical protein